MGETLSTHHLEEQKEKLPLIIFTLWPLIQPVQPSMNPGHPQREQTQLGVAALLVNSIGRTEIEK